MEEPWHLKRHSCRPEYAEVEEPPTVLNPSVTQNLVTDQAIEEDTGKPMPVVLHRCASPGENLLNTRWALAQIPDRSTGSGGVSDPRSLPVAHGPRILARAEIETLGRHRRNGGKRG